MSSKLESDVCWRLQVAPSGESWQKAMANYCWVYGVIHFTSPAGWLPVHRDQLRAQRSVTSMGKLYPLPFYSLYEGCDLYRHSPSSRTRRNAHETFRIPPLISNKKLSYRRGTARCVVSVANCHATVQKLLVRQVLNKSKLWSWRVKVGRCVVNMCTQPWRVRVAFIVLQVSKTNRRPSSCVYHLYTDDLLWRNFLRQQCRNCSHDPDHARLGNTHSSQD